MSERINPMRITDTRTGKVYELDFSRESVMFAERRGFNPDEVMAFPATRIPELFYLSFRKNHKNVARSQTDALLEALGGLTPAMVERLSLLYAQAGYSHLIRNDDDAGEEKNAAVMVEL